MFTRIVKTRRAAHDSTSFSGKNLPKNNLKSNVPDALPTIVSTKLVKQGEKRGQFTVDVKPADRCRHPPPATAGKAVVAIKIAKFDG